MNVCGCGGFVSRPAFPESMIITVPFGPSGFKKDHFCRCRLAHFLFFLFFCVLFVIRHVYHYFHNTTVNAQPLTPPIFEKIAPYSKKKKDNIMLGLCVCVVFTCLYFCLFSGTPCPPPRARLVPFLAECGAIVGRCW